MQIPSLYHLDRSGVKFKHGFVWNNTVDIDVQKDDPKSTEDEKTEARNEDEDSDKKDKENLMSHAAGRDAENLTSADQ